MNEYLLFHSIDTTQDLVFFFLHGCNVIFYFSCGKAL